VTATTSGQRGEPSRAATAHDASCSASQPLTPTGFEQRLLARARRLKLGAGDRVVVGFSGGPDSLALANALRWVERRTGCTPILVHVDHRLRPSSGEESRHAAELARVLGLSCRVETVAAPPQEEHPGLGIEEAARRARYGILFSVAREISATAVATAHNREDQAESVLLHLLRGSGVDGAAAMDEIGEVPRWPGAENNISQETSVVLWRPLLRESRQDILRYLAFAALEPIHDPSNDDRSLRRNALRHDIVPLLEARFPGAAAALARYAELAAAEDKLLDDLAGATLARCVHQGGVLEASCVTEHPLALRRRVLRRWLSAVPAAPSPTMDRTDAILDLARNGEGGRAVEIGEGWTVRLVGGMLRVERTAGCVAKGGADE
jgi:tRNA(Ile)-lysidine synthase